MNKLTKVKEPNIFERMVVAPAPAETGGYKRIKVYRMRQRIIEYKSDSVKGVLTQVRDEIEETYRIEWDDPEDS